MRNYWETASLGLSSAIVCGFLCSSWSSPPQFGVYPNSVRYFNLTVFLKGWMQRAACERSPSGIAEANWFHMSVIRSDAVPASIEVLSIARRSERVTHEQWEKKELSDFINMTSSWEKWAEVDSWVFGSLFFFFFFLLFFLPSGDVNRFFLPYLLLLFAFHECLGSNRTSHAALRLHKQWNAFIVVFQNKTASFRCYCGRWQVWCVSCPARRCSNWQYMWTIRSWKDIKVVRLERP